MAPPAPGLGTVERRYELVQDIADARPLDRSRARQGRGRHRHRDDARPTAPLAELVGIALALAPGEACYIPLGHRAAGAQGALDLAGATPAAETPKQIPRADGAGAAEAAARGRSVLKIGHDIKFDVAVLAGAGIALAPVD